MKKTRQSGMSLHLSNGMGKKLVQVASKMVHKQLMSHENTHHNLSLRIIIIFLIIYFVIGGDDYV
jgi:hypothetical protein